MHERGRAVEPLQPRRCHAVDHCARHAISRVDMPTGRAFEPGATREWKAPAALLEYDANTQRFAARQVEFDLGLELAVGETQLLGSGLEQYAASAQHAQHFGCVFTAQFSRSGRA